MSSRIEMRIRSITGTHARAHVPKHVASITERSASVTVLLVTTASAGRGAVCGHGRANQDNRLPRLNLYRPHARCTHTCTHTPITGEIR